MTAAATDPRDAVVTCAVVLLGLLSARQIRPGDDPIRDARDAHGVLLDPDRRDPATIAVDRRALLDLADAVERAAPGHVDRIRGRRARRRGGGS